MAKIASHMIPLGTKAPLFELEDAISGQKVYLDDGDTYTATVLMFICNHCPYVKHINAELTRLANHYIPQNVRFIAISSNDVEKYPADSPENMKLSAETYQYPFPYLYDATQEVAKAYNAACTPDFYLFDGELTLVYRGQLDGSRPGNNIPVDGSSLRLALDCVLSKQPLNFIQQPSLGCSIKWKTN